MSQSESETLGSRSEVHAGRKPEELRQDIEEQKESIAGTLKQIDRRLHRATDWRTHVGEHPFLAVGIAFSIGGLLSAAFRRRPTPRERILDALAESVEDISGQVRDRIVSQFSHSFARGMLKASAAALVTKMAANYIESRTNAGPDSRRNGVDAPYVDDDPEY